jgi:hypothetical protein
MQVDPESDETLPRARTARSDGGGGGAHRAKFTGGFLFFSSRRGPGTLVVLADVSNDLDT